MSNWTQLRKLADAGLPPLNDMFAGDATRAESMSFQVGGIFADFSKQRITTDVVQALLALAQDKNVAEKRADLFAGLPLNFTEKRAVLHPALRGSSHDKATQKLVKDMRTRTRKFAEDICTEGKYQTVVHIGIGGSDLGPRLLADGFAASGKPALDLRFANNVDGASINDALAGLNPATTLVVIVSKSFGTQETRMNGEAARDWLGKFTSDNMVAVTANKDAAVDFGLDPAQIFEFWDWVGGRFSLWSAVGLSLQLAYGPDMFDDLLAGAASMDAHFQTAPLEKNLPVMLALTDIWNNNFLGLKTRAVVPYARRLRKLSSFLQQLEMESNGKSVTTDGSASVDTNPVVWGDEGANAQHAFFQQLHQGTQITPVDFIAVLTDHENRPAHTLALLANCFAQSEALMRGKSEAEVRTELKAKGLSKSDINALAPHKTFPGNRPSTTIVLERLDAHTLGALIAAYEHKVFVQSIIWNINAFDQWGVELGKELAGTILSELQNGETAKHDSSTSALITRARNAQGGE
ncbi:MAG: glucose-6-phosphate isomerase [Robiginitomaculum sp.]|nr:glucose-6-phosphate isomerase [Robiginitomaculum sp.]